MSTDHGQVFSSRRSLGPRGLCAQRDEHPGHLHDSPSLGRFWCTADQSQREPWRSERRRASVSFRCPACGFPPTLPFWGPYCLDPRHRVYLP